MFEARDVLQAYHNREQNKKLKQHEDELYKQRESLYELRLNGQLFIEKKGYGPLTFDMQDITDRYNLRIDEHLNWGISAVNEKEKCHRIFQQPKIDSELLKKTKVPLIVYSEFGLPLEGLAVCFPYSHIACSNNIQHLIVQTGRCVCACSERTAKGSDRL